MRIEKKIITIACNTVFLRSSVFAFLSFPKKLLFANDLICHGKIKHGMYNRQGASAKKNGCPAMGCNTVLFRYCPVFSLVRMFA